MQRVIYMFLFFVLIVCLFLVFVLLYGVSVVCVCMIGHNCVLFVYVFCAYVLEYVCVFYTGILPPPSKWLKKVTSSKADIHL